ncbi:MAG: alpha/beta hydrolase-fold protein, partial [Oscillospiraceae bacterium]|nr:alpha/beta hydrolase-fold protein [Oscillospiraceae bacterium]
LPTAQYATKMGVTVFASPWEPPADLAESGGSNGKLHLPKSNYAAYAQHLNDFGTYMKNNNVDLYAISVQNEPDYASEWTYWSTDETTDFIANYGDKITSTRLMSPESFQYAPENASWVPDGGKKFYRKILNNSKAMENCDLFGTHFYGTQRDWMDFPDLENSGKEIWMTEVYVPNSEQDSANRYPEALQVSENIHNAMVVGNMSAYTWWYIRRHYGLMTEDGKISKRGYCMAQYSKYVRPGDVRIDATEQPADNVYVSAYKGDDNQVTIVAINKGTEGYAQNFTISGETISNVDRYRTSANENLAPTLNMEYSENGFYAQLPAESVSTFVITLSEKAEEPNEYGWYFHSTFEGDLDSWSGRGAADVLTSGRTAYVGGESLLVQNRTAAWNGAARALNASAFVPGKEYSFSANVMYFDGDATDQFFLKLQYTDANGDTQYQTIAKGTAIKGEWVQLANKNYKIPEDATNMQIYIETAETTNNFYVDEVIGAVGGTTILGAGESKNIILGDLNFDGVINAVDLCLLKRHYAGTFPDSASKIAADVDQSGKVDATDVKLLQDFLLARITEFPVIKKPIESETEIDPVTYMNQVRENLSEYALSGCTEEYSWVEYGTMTKYQYYSTTRERMTNVNVLLPPGYDENETYPVLYALHGYWETEDSLAAMGNVRNMLGNLISTGDAEKMIVVFPYIYTSKYQETCSGLDLANSLNYDNFINDLTTDLMPYIESNFSVKTGRENTAITGFSMGGRESLFIGLTRSDLFGYVGAACPAPGLTPGSDLSLHPGQLQENQLKPAYNQPYLIMLTGGGNDGTVGNQPSLYHNILTNNGVDHVWHSVTTGGHDATSVQPHFYNYLRYIFKTK